ncbi:PHP domain-containing protein [Yersinia enterocolitica]|nr:PHP domain-containing protein [Yersinia enterocolitica]EKN3993672.1 PHP domain-containing protein [Yersinia enterocolitica]EKN5084834.1 PHP domain-containing protein [Yersinia enterocolitica]EKP3834848.1 PHP domain-containing protein [Yersinia enterocolitica]ELI8138052.1 PHP domain-containing protein [Yersinia enterocolitica]
MAYGAHFHRGDLHIHSFGDGGSYDVNDDQMTPANIVAKAIEKNLSIISITDHNKIKNSIEAVNISVEKKLLVIPGIEVSTTQGHLLVYFPTNQDLENFYGKLVFDPSKKFCTQGIHDCLEYALKYNGIGILAHIEVDSGFEMTIGKFNEIFDQAFQHPAILALEIKNHDSINYYTEFDGLADRKTAMKKRNTKLGYPENYKLAKIMSSDAHSMNAFGKNAAGADRLTRFKMDELSFESLRIALFSHDSRVRLEDDIPLAIPKFKEFKATGGILDGMHVEFRNNMNCIIGGRGTGKSTLITAIQEASSNPVISTNIQKSNVWPTKIELKYENEAGQEFLCILEHGKLECLNEHGETVEAVIPIEAYSQGFTTFTNNAEPNEKDEKLLNFFDSFISVEHLQKEDDSKITQLITNFEHLERLTNETSQKSEVEKELKQLLSKKEAYEKQNVGELMKLHSGLIEEAALRKHLENSLSELKKRYELVLSEKDDINELLMIDIAKVNVGKENVQNVINIIQDFSDIVDHHQKELNEELTEKLNLLRTEIIEWRNKEKGAKEQIEIIKKKLDEDKIPYDETKFVKLSTDITKLQRRSKDIEKSEKRLKETQVERKQLLRDRESINSNIHNKRLEFCTRINKDLSESVDGLFVHAKIGRGYLAKDLSSFIKKSMGWQRWANSDKIANSISPLSFYGNMKYKKHQFLRDLDFDKNDIDEIANTINGLILEKIISIPFKERPELTVTRHNKSNGTAEVKDISQLSLGQQQSIMLSILIQSDSCLPLIIDQPEDNLDSEFIFNSVVANLRKCKERRQIIVVTHNSNIGVLGDAELVIPLIASNEKSSIADLGSIDNRKTQEQCCEILEGGKRAFTTRKEIYRI